ncbi:uncharacterized protein PHACADRAFT_178962 [Phanerochaete carnosa HHB-10118-sp]|uniref:Uncharacterized protein n=1 Tax=Phanerochaete carnosa (strain HHB-10118-sp) TaxID=650164 RepID=K5VRZ2_PHACS|nr:uncharacterized protein PHACADRAFT_178962 [Phanerochaete carnosa HHB-10118-sp]EKM49540.1 hypothetical protein PHACADRAFT_178962 [Phanerochaete carnosa HHB-10118-sp]
MSLPWSPFLLWLSTAEPMRHGRDRCLVELWTKIITLACADRGYTGRSLSLVSRMMRDIVEPVHFQSVSLVHEEQLLAFSSLLYARRRSPPVTRHLFVFVRVSYRSRRAAKFESLRRTIHDIVSVAAPNLESLVVYGARSDLASSGLVFPALRDLVIGGLHSTPRMPPVSLPFATYISAHSSAALASGRLSRALPRLSPTSDSPASP